MAISNLRPASAFEVAWRGVSSDDLAAEAAARAAADAALQAAIDAEEAARIADVNAEETRAKAAEAALAADIDAASDLARSELLTEPAVSELASMWSTVLTGEPKDRANLAASNVVFDGVDGLVIRVTAAGNRAPRAAYRMVPGHKYEVLAVARRKVNPVDSTDKSVRLRAMWLTASKAQVSAVDLESFVLLGSGIHIYRKVVSLAAGAEVDVVAAAGTVYFTPFVQTFGTDGTTNILPYIRVTDLTSNTLVSADVSGLDARLTALESQDLDDRLSAVESLVAGSDIARFETRAKAASAATAGSILAGVDVLETLGLADGGDDVVKSYSRELADPGFGDRFHDAGGSWWVGRAQGLQGVKGMVELRRIAPVTGRSIFLNFHTTAGDHGAGEFYGVTGAAAGTYVDNEGTIIVPTGGDGSAAWLRLWDHIKAHVGWFGAKCTPWDAAVDDYIPVKKCFDLFTDGRKAKGEPGAFHVDQTYTGVIDIGPGFCFSQPLIYGGALGSSFKLVGRISNGRSGFEQSLLRYIGPETYAAVIFYGANEWSIEDINIYPGLALTSYLITADNTYNNFYTHTTTAAITAGNNVVVTPAGGPAVADRILWLQAGVLLGIDDGGPNFEIVYITAVDTTAGTFTANFKKNHASGVLLGGGAPSSSGWVNRCEIQARGSPVWTKLTADAPGTGSKTFHVTSMTGITVGRSIRVGSLLFAEVVYPTAVNVGANTFTANSQFDHLTGALVMYPTAGITVGNRLLGTVQVDNISFSDVFLAGNQNDFHPGTTTTTSRAYAGFRQLWGGNVKAFFFRNMFPQSIRVAFACEQSSGQYIFHGGSSAACYETLWQGISATLTVEGWEDESYAMWLASVSGTSPSHATFIGCTMQGRCPDDVIVESSDEMFVCGGNLTFIGCSINNYRVFSDGVSEGTLPIIVSSGVSEDIGVFPAGLALINCEIGNATLANFNKLVRRSSGDATNILQSGPGNVTMLNNIGNVPGTNVRLPNILPPQKMWEASATYNPPSLSANTAGTAQTMSVPGAALGDLVEVSFSENLGEALLRAWVSAADTVSYQFRNPTAGPLDIGSATSKVKCRVKK